MVGASLAGFKGLVSGLRGLFTRRRAGKKQYSQRSRMTNRAYLVEVRWNVRPLLDSSNVYDTTWRTGRSDIMRVVSMARKQEGPTIMLYYSESIPVSVMIAAKAFLYVVARIGDY